MSQTQDTGKKRKNTMDQYYTKAAVAKKCVDKILELCPESAGYQWVEPSAGSGAFLKALPSHIVNSVGVDLEPKGPNILKGDFLAWSAATRPCIIFGNPPFGKQGSIAKSFIKHAASMASVIAFILPRSFVKPSMSRAFPLEFHCIFSEELEKNAFEVNGSEYDVPCVFQIWQKRGAQRLIAEPIHELGFAYVKAGQPYHIAFKRVGGLAGKCSPSSAGPFHPQYHYFLALEEAFQPHAGRIIERVNQHVFPSNTVGPRSLSKSEANEVLNEVLAACLEQN
jgi:hypothetical protein